MLATTQQSMKKLLLIIALTAVSSLRADPPKLVVSIVVDQLRYDYLERFDKHFAKGGFRLFKQQGAFLSRAFYDYCPTYTAPGHATILSGAPPAEHGIIGNDWFNKRTRRSMYCVEDPSVEGVGTKGSGGQRSPKNFIGSNLADQMRLHFRSKVVGISMKDRGAILPAGKQPNGAYWLDTKTGHFVTSTYYTEALPKWVKSFNDEDRAGGYVGKTWDRLLPESAYTWGDRTAGEGVLSGEKEPVFPHVVAKSRSAITRTPFANELVIEFAKAALDAEKLGQGSGPDLLCISFSANDYAGHSFGPHSQEVQDITVRLDRQLEDFFQFLDQRIGLGNVLINLTADHGVAPNPEFATAQGMDGDRLNEGQIMIELMSALSKEFGPEKFFLDPRGKGGQLFFDHAVLAKRNIPLDAFYRFIREWAFDTGKYQHVYTREQLLDGRAPGHFGQLVLNGYNAERSADMILISKPFAIPSKSPTGTTHGSPYAYDTHVPVMFFGPGIKPGRYADDFKVTDIAPTLAAILRVEVPPGSIGRPLTKLLR